ncbi:MAG: DUF5683 domain-containing protein [Flavobacteriales bacterium]|nr:DUF5683 domain-containing protein [Flavobacteriales bacterium]
MPGRILILLLFTFSWGVYAQDTIPAIDTTSVKKKKRQKKVYPIDTSYHHSFKTATILSAIVPGAGQMYNEIGYRKYRNKKHRAWWKVPIIYGGLGVTSYFFYTNYTAARARKEEYLFRQDNPSVAYQNPEFALHSDSQLTTEFDDYSKSRDIFIFATIGVYALNIVEALVDAHFVTFDVSENLTFQWAPTIIDRNTAALNLTLRF